MDNWFPPLNIKDQKQVAVRRLVLPVGIAYLPTALASKLGRMYVRLCWDLTFGSGRGPNTRMESWEPSLWAAKQCPENRDWNEPSEVRHQLVTICLVRNANSRYLFNPL